MIARRAATMPRQCGLHTRRIGVENIRNNISVSSGTLQADAFAGFNKIYESGDVQEAACWAHYLESRIIWTGCN